MIKPVCLLRRLILGLAVIACLAVPTTTFASKGNGGHASSHASSHGSSAKRSGSAKPVHVKGFTKKDGTHVAAHDRKAPEPKGDSRTTEATHSAPIRVYTDPTTGRKTITNATSFTPHTSRTIPPRVVDLAGIARNAKGRIARSEAAKHTFEVQSQYPHGRPGYVVDHIKPIACGGADAPNNMQWQTIAAAKAKDKVERVGCR